MKTLRRFFFLLLLLLRHLWPEARSRLQISAQKGAREARAGQRAEQRETANREERFEDDNWNLSTVLTAFGCVRMWSSNWLFLNAGFEPPAGRHGRDKPVTVPLLLWHSSPGASVPQLHCEFIYGVCFSPLN